ncbi:MAG: acyl-CoA dehydrogenase family protein, partial [Candidatus Limnocylindria bacterium]
GVALGGLLPGAPRLRARPAAGGWVLDGTSPWVSGIGRIDVLQVAARDDAGTVVSALVDARAGATIDIEPPRELVAVTASANAPVHFRDHHVPAERITSLQSYAERMARDREVIRMHAALALGVAARCARLAGESPIDGQIAAVRDRLDAATAETMPPARAAASDLALRASAYLVAVSGSRSIARDQHAQRLAREALFLVVFGSRPAVRDALLQTLAREGAPRP